jgi:hypothetical protein
MSPLRAQQVNAIYRFVTMAYYYNYHNSGHYPSSCLLLKNELKLNSTQLYRFIRTSQETHYVPLRAQQVNVIYRFVTMVY